MAWDQTYAPNLFSTNGRVDLPSSVLSASGVAGVTLVMSWDCANIAGSGGFFGNWSTGAASTDNEILFRSNAQMLQFYIKLEGSSSGPAQITSAFNASVGDYFRLAFRYTDSSGEMKVWRKNITDDDAIGTGTFTYAGTGTQWGGTSSVMRFGEGYNVGSQPRQNGRTRDAAMWQSRALSDAEVEALINRQVHPLVLAADNVWPGTQTTGTQLTDVAGGEHGTLVNCSYGVYQNYSYRSQLPNGPMFVTTGTGVAPPAGTIARQHYHHRHHNFAG